MWLKFCFVVFLCGRCSAAGFSTIPNFTLLGKGRCWGDDLYRTMNYMKMTISVGSDTIEAASLGCADMCRELANMMDRCMGFEAYSDGQCKLFDRDWVQSEKNMAESVLSTVVGTPIALSAKGIQDFPGKHLIRLFDDPHELSKSPHEVACYRRIVICNNLPQTCTSLNRYDCSLGKVSNTCDVCLPRHQGVDGPSNLACAVMTMPPPTLRIALAMASFEMDSEGSNSYYVDRSVAFLSALYAMKYYWENNVSFLPNAWVPPSHRQQFNVEIYGYTENYTKSRVAGARESESEQISHTSIVPGIRAMSGASGGEYARDLDLKELPPGTRPHCVIGRRASSSADEAETEAEAALLAMGDFFQTPVFGWSHTSEGLRGEYYIRSNRIATSAGSAIARLLTTIGYTVITVVQQFGTSLVSDQLKSLLPASSTISVIDLPEDAKGSCDGGKLCREAILRTVRRLREDDARVIVHEIGNDLTEFILWTAIDLLGEKTSYIRTGASCGGGQGVYLGYFSSMAWAQADYRFVDAVGFNDNLEESCSICPNAANYVLSDEQRKNWTFVVDFLYSDANPYLAQQSLWCPQFPTSGDLLNCSYCNGAASSFPSPGCWTLKKEFEEKVSRSMCIQPDLHQDYDRMEAYTNAIMCVGVPTDKCFGPFSDASSATSVANLKASGFPASYMAPYEAGGTLYESGLQTSFGRALQYHRAWNDIDLNDALGRQDFSNAISLANGPALLDALMTAIIGYNEFVRLGGDADRESSATAMPKSERQGNSVAAGWKQLLLNTDFGGFLGDVSYVTKGPHKGDHNIDYQILQVKPPSRNSCKLRISSFGNHTIHNLELLTFQPSIWNFLHASVHSGLTGELKLPQSGNELACNPMPERWYAGGYIALVKRGDCYFGTKMKHALDAGAMLMILVDTASFRPLFMVGASRTLTRPGISIGRDEGLLLWEAIETYGTTIIVDMAASTDCMDDTYPKNSFGATMYSLVMTYDLKRDELSLKGGGTASCLGSPGSPGVNGEPLMGANCSGIIFSDGNLYGNGTIHPPGQIPPQCGDGQEYSVALRSCVDCNAGRYRSQNANGSMAQCIECGLGRYASSGGSTSCSSCPEGTFAGHLGRKDCQSCGKGSFSSTRGAINCLECSPGFYASLNGSSSCDLCSEGGVTTDFGKAECKLCHAGSMPDSGKTSCIPCPGGFITPRGSAECEECSIWTKPSKAKDLCEVSMSTISAVCVSIATILFIIAYALFRKWQGARASAAFRKLLQDQECRKQVPKLQKAVKRSRKLRLKVLCKDLEKQLVIQQQKYIEFDAFHQIVEEGNLRMVRGSWAAEKENLPRFARQQDVQGCHWTAKQFLAQQSALAVVALSYCWLHPVHPDPKRIQLEIVRHALQLRLSVEGPGQVTDIALFIDYLSIAQHGECGDPADPDPGERRTPEEQQSFKAGLSVVNIPYGHQRTETWMMQWTPPDVEWKYHERAWPSFEETVSSLVKHPAQLLNIGLESLRSRTWTKVFKNRTKRLPPHNPEVFNEMIARKHITNDTDIGILIKSYKEAFTDVIGHARILWFVAQGWGDDEAERIAQVIPWCDSLQEMLVGDNAFSFKGAMKLIDASRTCSTLVAMDLSGNHIDADMPALQEAWDKAGKPSEGLNMSKRSTFADFGCMSSSLGLGDWAGDRSKTRDDEQKLSKVADRIAQRLVNLDFSGAKRSDSAMSLSRSFNSAMSLSRSVSDGAETLGNPQEIVVDGSSKVLVDL